jgi:hypothetical protein
MGKTKEQHETEILEIVIKNKIMKINHIFQHYTDLQHSQFYNLELDKSESIKEAITTNKSKAVSYMLNKWVGSDNATLQISAFKVLCEDEDRKKLSMQFVESENSHQVRKFEVEILKPKDEDTDQ